MAKKEKEEKKDKKEKKNKKEKKDKKKNDKSEKNENDKKQSKSSVALNVSVCGSPSAVQLYLDTIRSAKDSNMDGCQFKVYADPGTDDQGNIENSSGDIFLCVYSVTDPQTVKFLEDKVLPKLSDSEKVIAGLGLENRTANSAKVVPKDTASRLGRQFKCDSMELVSCDGNQLAVGTATLYRSVNPSKFSSKSQTTEADGEEQKGKKKKDKKSKEKKDKDKKKKKKSKKSEE